MPRGGQTLDVLYEDNHLLAVDKPAMLPTMGVEADRPSLLAIARDYLREKYAKPGNVYLGIVSRLDSPVTGVVLMAKTSKAAARLSEAFRTRRVRKIYLAAVAGEPAEASGELVHYLRKDVRHRKVHCTHELCPGAQLARLKFQVLRSSGEYSLVEVELETGRKHQIRVQLAKQGHAIVGDRKYGSVTPFAPGIALHSRRLELVHPVRDEAICLEAPVPAAWGENREIGRLLAGR